MFVTETNCLGCHVTTGSLTYPSRTFPPTYRTINWIAQLAAHRSLLPSQLAGLIHRGSSPASHGMSRMTPRSPILLPSLALANNLQQLLIIVRSPFISERFHTASAWAGWQEEAWRVPLLLLFQFWIQRVTCELAGLKLAMGDYHR